MRLCAGLLSALVGTTAAAALSLDPEEAKPRPITEAERRAVELAALYLAEGPEAWREELAADHPWRGLGKEAARAEIGVRAGPPQGATWQLQTPGVGAPDGRAIFSIEFPSGADETLVVTLGEEREGWKIRELRSLADPPSAPPLEGPLGLSAVSPPGPPAASAGDPPGPAPAALAALLVLASVLLRGRYAGRRPTAGLGPRAAAAALASIPLVLAAATLSCSRQDGGSGRVEEAPAAAGEALLGELQALRFAMASGEDAARLESLFAAVPGAPGRLAEVARLWRAQLLLWQVDLREAADLIDSLPQPSSLPLASLLRARLALVRADLDQLRPAYEEARAVGPDHDGLRMEQAQALTLVGLDDEAQVAFVQLAEMGSRLAEVHYAVTQVAALEERGDAGREFLRVAWHLEPRERKEIFADPLLASIAAHPEVFPLFALSSAGEPVVAPARRGGRPVELPPGALSTLSGRHLRIELGDAKLLVPGGAELALPEAEVEDAGTRRRREQAEALAEVMSLPPEERGPGFLAQPRLRQRLLAASEALASESRWQELVELTEGVAGVIAQAPSAMVRLRAAALDQLDRSEEAKRLLVELAKINTQSHRRDPGTLYQLAELFAASGEYDLALQLIRRAATLVPLARNEHRLRQIAMEKRLYEAPERWRSDSFEIVYPRRTGERYARDLAAVLEEERRRLRRWIPSDPGRPIEVNLFPLEEFLRAYSVTTLVLGIFDERVNVPFADLRSLHPELVRILTHEVAHAMIHQATREQAPPWLHEGLAQHVEMGSGRINPIPELARTGRILAFPMLDPILQGFSEAQVIDIAYSQSAWAVHYLEAKHGLSALHRLLEAFASGKTTEEALKQVTGLTAEGFDQAAWRWCRDQAPEARSLPVRRYDREYESLVRRTAVDRREPPGPGPRSPAAGSRRRLTMADWHADYTAKVAPFKEALAPLLGPLRSGDGEAVPPLACQALARRVDGLLRDAALFASPDARVHQALRRAFVRFRDMAAACQRGDFPGVRRSLAEAERHLAEAAEALERYNLQP